MSAHDPTKRAEAAARPRAARPSALDGAQAGHIAHKPGVGSVWVPVGGPHLRATRTTNARSRTGCVGISYGTIVDRRTARQPRRRYFIVNLGKTSRKFCIDTLGKELAWERALRCRAAHERAIRAVNAAILAARKEAA